MNEFTQSSRKNKYKFLFSFNNHDYAKEDPRLFFWLFLLLQIFSVPFVFIYL